MKSPLKKITVAALLVCVFSVNDAIAGEIIPKSKLDEFSRRLSEIVGKNAVEKPSIAKALNAPVLGNAGKGIIAVSFSEPVKLYGSKMSSGPVLTTINVGERASLLGKRGDYIAVGYGDELGWVKDEALKPIEIFSDELWNDSGFDYLSDPARMAKQMVQVDTPEAPSSDQNTLEWARTTLQKLSELTDWLEASVPRITADSFTVQADPVPGISISFKIHPETE